MDVQKTLDNIVSFSTLDALFKSGSLEIFPSALQQQQTVITVVLVLLGMYLENQSMASEGATSDILLVKFIGFFFEYGERFRDFCVQDSWFNLTLWLSDKTRLAHTTWISRKISQMIQRPPTTFPNSLIHQ